MNKDVNNFIRVDNDPIREQYNKILRYCLPKGLLVKIGTRAYHYIMDEGIKANLLEKDPPKKMPMHPTKEIKQVA